MKKILGLLTLSLGVSTILVGCGSDEASASGVDSETEITVVSREDGSGTRGAFIEIFGVQVKDDEGNKVDETYDEAVIANKTSIVMTNVANDPNAIGYISLGSLNDTVKALQIEGVEASIENIQNGSYEVFREFNITYTDDLSELGQDFISFMLSTQGQEVISDSYIGVEGEAYDYETTLIEDKLIVAGSSSVSPAMEKLKEAYELLNTNATIEIQTTDSTSGVNATIDGTCDIGMASRSLKDEELEQVNGEVIALDGLAVVVNNDNVHVDSLSKEQVRSIFTGETTIWENLE